MSDKNHNDTKSPIISHHETFGDAEKIRQQLNELPVEDVDIKKKDTQKISNNQDAVKGLTASMHIVSGVLVGGLLGYGLDVVCHTVPFFTVIMFPIGMIAGFRNMLRTLDAECNKDDNQNNG
jgi:F0F1-type ATP synthase assembly protein I